MGPLTLKTLVVLTPPFTVLVMSGPMALYRPTPVLLIMSLGTGMTMVSLLVATSMLLYLAPSARPSVFLPI